MIQIGTQSGDSPTVTLMMGDSIIPDERILKALHNSRLTDDLRDFEINVLSSLMAVRYFEIKEFVVVPEDISLKGTLMILVEGKIDISAMVDNELVSLVLETPGDLARIVSFVGGNVTNIHAGIKVKKNSAVLLLQRSKLETLLHSHPFIVYCVMRNLVRHVHGISRRKNAEKEELSNYLYRFHGLY